MSSRKESSALQRQCWRALSSLSILFTGILIGVALVHQTEDIKASKLLIMSPVASISSLSALSLESDRSEVVKIKESSSFTSTSTITSKNFKDVRGEGIGGGSSSGGGGVCESFPMSDRSLPLGASHTIVTNGFAQACNGVYGQRVRTFKLSYDNEKTKVTVKKLKLRPDSEQEEQPPIDCSEVLPPPTITSYNKLNDKVPAYDQLRTCFNNSGHPFISFRGAPKKDFGPSEIGSKDGIAILTNKYAPCDEMKNPGSCMLPETFRISDSREDCLRFFDTIRYEKNNSDPTKSPRLWIRKPVHGLGGFGIERLFDPLEELKDYETACSNDVLRQSLRNIVVQQYIRPKLVLDGRSFHLRIYFLYKFARNRSKLHSSPSQMAPAYASSGSASAVATNHDEEAEDDDPPQAWHIKIGNVHLCSEPYSMINDPKMSTYAVKCNGMAWKENPRIIREGGWMEFNFTMPYPSFLRESFTEAEYDLVMSRIDGLLKTLAKVLRGTAEHETQTYAMDREALWMILGNDIMIDENLRPWLIEVNACPGNIEYGTENILTNAHNLNRNPHMAAYRLVMTHYKRYHVGDDYYDENACEVDDELGQYVTRVM